MEEGLGEEKWTNHTTGLKPNLWSFCGLSTPLLKRAAPPIERGPTCGPGLGVIGQGGAGSGWEHHPSHHCFLPRALRAGWKSIC